MKKIIVLMIVIIILAFLAVVGVNFYKNVQSGNPNIVLNEYFSLIQNGEYEKMYDLITLDSQNTISKEDFVKRNKNIYNGIDTSNIQIEISQTEKIDNSNSKITYKTTIDTSAGKIEFSNTSNLIKNKEKEYKIDWSSKMIFPELENDYKVRVNKDEAIRGSIVDRNGNYLATQGNVSSIGIVPGKLGANKDENISKISELLNISVESINKTLSASWVKEDSFVPLTKVAVTEAELKQKLLEIPGIKISTTTDRVYPYSFATSHLTGYIQSITAEELEKHAGKGYSSTSRIGKNGLEKQYEERLKGTNGIEIYITDNTGNKIKTIAKTEKKDGENIKLTIDINIQNKLYEQLKNDKGFFVVMHPKTGELLALVSTPSYDANEFVLGLTTDEWNTLSQNENKPMYNRYLQTWCPGSTFKPVTGAIGLTSGKLSQDDEFSYNGLAWKKDASWGNYEITTLTPYNSSKNLRNALIHSDNIYFAQATLQIGADTFMQGLDKLKFNENIDVLNISKSKYSNSGKIEKETLLADSGYGQGQILVNPIHMASIYSAFVNNGNMIKPYIEYTENIETQYLVENAFSKEAADIIKDDLIQVIENPNGTAHDMKINGLTLAGKTGTAELKQAKGEEGETLGWFDCVTTDENGNQLLVISMVEDAKTNGGSHYLIKKIRTLFE